MVDNTGGHLKSKVARPNIAIVDMEGRFLVRDRAASVPENKVRFKDSDTFQNTQHVGCHRNKKRKSIASLWQTTNNLSNKKLKKSQRNS
jgi:hypothetical protein